MMSMPVTGTAATATTGVNALGTSATKSFDSPAPL